MAMQLFICFVLFRGFIASEEETDLFLFRYLLDFQYVIFWFVDFQVSLALGVLRAEFPKM